MYNKLFAKILDSSIWLEPTATRIVWLTFIAVMDENGYAHFASVANVAHRARVTLTEAQVAVTALEGPDPDSSDPDHDGRRIERVPGGWMVLNADKHKQLVTSAIVREQTRLRVQKHRLKRNSNADVTPSETETEITKIKAVASPPSNGNGSQADTPKDNIGVIMRIAHEALDSLGTDSFGDVVDYVKTLCARRRIVYDSSTVGGAVESAIIQRNRANV